LRDTAALGERRLRVKNFTDRANTSLAELRGKPLDKFSSKRPVLQRLFRANGIAGITALFC
jgi:hypothetical protein